MRPVSGCRTPRGNFRVEGNGVFDNAGDEIRTANNATRGYVYVWKDNVGLTDGPPTLCAPP